MFFVSKRKKGTEAATAALRPLIANAQQSGGVSSAFFESPYILGFMQLTAAFFAKAATSNRISATDLGFALQDAFSNVSNRNGVELLRRAVQLAEQNDPECARGGDDAAAIIFYNQRMLRDEDQNPLVIKASKSVEAQSSSLGEMGDRRAMICAVMMELTYLREIKLINGAPR